MPTIADITNAAIPAGLTLAQWLASRSALNSATGAINRGAASAGTGLDAASTAAIQAQKNALAAQQGIATGSVGRTDAATVASLQAQKDAAAKQQGLYQTTVDANSPYANFGTQSIKQLQDLQLNPGNITTLPGYQFELDQGLKAGQRAAAASGTLGNGGTIRAQTRYALDYAATKYQQALDNLNRSVGIGERANAANQSAANVLGSEVGQNANEVAAINRTGANESNATMGTLGTETGTEATNVGLLGTRNAEDRAALTLAQAQTAAKNEVLQGNNTNTLLGTVAGLAPTIARLIPGAATAGTVATGAPTVLGGTAAAGGGVTGALTGAAGALAHGAAALATNPIGWAIGGGIGATLLAKHFIGQGRKTADKLTGSGGIQHAFEDTLKEIDAQPGLTAQQSWSAKEEAYQKLKGLALDFAKKGSTEKKVASQMFDTIAPLFGEPNPLKAA